MEAVNQHIHVMSNDYIIRRIGIFLIKSKGHPPFLLRAQRGIPIMVQRESHNVAFLDAKLLGR
ncbi:MAG: hypothetical protein AMJ88_06400 [Anaerolineae bacterium SM23_ 63]|nr:MAG: hypothetical protein AMJ88_06400 [Anaerolineae bacterium SM23_ 63]